LTSVQLRLPNRSTSHWIATAPGAPHPPLEGDAEVDVAILGAGITGITAALLLQRAGKRVAILEAQRVAEGVTGYTTAHLTEAIDTRYASLARSFGVEGARLAAEASRGAIDLIERLVREKTIHCGFTRLPGYLFTDRDEEIESLHEEYEAARSASVDVDITDHVPLPFATRAAVVFANQAQFHVRAYLLALVDELVRGGALVCERTRALSVEENEPCVVRTQRGTVRATWVIEATNSPLNRVFLQTKIASYRSYVVAAEIGDAPLRGLFWDTKDPYHYLRMSGDLLIAGGEDHKTGTEEATHLRYERLAAWLGARFEVRELRDRWSAQVLEPVDGLPFIGRNSMSKRVFVATGYGGNGMTFGTVAAMIFFDEILGRKNAWAELFQATRVKPVAGLQQYVTENVDYPKHMIGDRLRRAEARDTSEIRPGAGKIVRVHGRKLAVYRDDEGALHAVSPVCSHLGCHVQFNDAERTWDCPCHGSRFSPDGRVVNGPATKPLKQHAIDERDRFRVRAT
jgi:glycine/D-amino acid oxidase-like deaminating enzyme/nitrite reductase/ring-hydroxylating ferredoxin subunit